MAALASRSPRSSVRSSESLHALAFVPGLPSPGTGCTLPEQLVCTVTAGPGNAGHTVLGLTGQSRAAQRSQPALVTLDSLFAFARLAPLRVA